MRNWLIEIRNHNKMTQSQVAEKCHLTRQYLGMLENNHKLYPHPKKAKRIADALEFEKNGIHWTKFYEDENQIENTKEEAVVNE